MEAIVTLQKQVNNLYCLSYLMHAMIYLLLLPLCYLAYVAKLQLQLRGFRVLRSVHTGPVDRVLLDTTYMDKSRQERYPEPREERALVLSLWHCPLWIRHQSVALPMECDARIDQIQPSEFDRYFQPAFRYTPSER